MGRFAPKLSDVMRDAIRAAAAEGRSAPEIVELAAAGGLGGDGLRSFDVSESAVREIAGEVRGRAADSGAIEAPAPVDVIATRAQAVLEREMGRLEERSGGDGLSGQDASQLRRLLLAAREIKALQLGFVTPGRRTQRLAAEQPADGNGDVESPILAAIEAKRLEAQRSEAESAGDDD
jgi:hypothetical protein